MNIRQNDFFKEAAKAAKKATCLRAKCGTVIVKNNIVIGTGYNSPPLGNESRRTCNMKWDYQKKPKYDLTCCIHAEWRAILDACRNYPKETDGSTLYFMRIDESGNYTNAGEPYCTVCSRLAMESGIGYFALYDNGETTVYPTNEYDKKSFEYHR